MRAYRFSPAATASPSHGTKPWQQLFAELSLFQGGWTEEAATALSDDIEGTQERLASLVDKSLLQLEPTPRGSRYRFLETVREFAVVKLGKLPEENRLSLQRHHLGFFFELVRSGIGDNSLP